MQFSHAIQLYETDPKLVHHFVDGIIAISSDHKIKFWNFGATLMYGYTEAEALGMSISELIPERFETRTLKSFNTEVGAGCEWRGEVTHTKKDQSLIYCSISICRIHENDDEGYLIVTRDISERKQLEHLLQKMNFEFENRNSVDSNELASFFERIHEGVVAFDKQWTYRHINSKAAQILGKTSEELIGKNVWALYPKAKESKFYGACHEAMATEKFVKFEDYSIYIDKWFDVSVYPGKEGLYVFFQDVTERKRTDKLLNDREELYRKIVETAQEGIWTIDDKNHTTFVNTCMANMLGYERHEMIGKDPSEFVEIGSYQKVMDDLTAVRAGATSQFDYCLLTKTKSKKWVLINATPIMNDGVYAGALAMIMDITERKKREEELNESHEQLRHLASRLQTIREEERSSIARDIHDELGQQLTALKMDAYWIAKNQSDQNETFKRKIDSIMSIANHALEVVEKKAIELHPNILHDLGLLSAIEWQNREFQNRFGIAIDFSSDGSDQGLPNEVALAFYRIYQEALNNISRHAEATSIIARFERNIEGMSLSIQDDGKGFDQERLDRKKSLGLLGMRERAFIIGGTFDIQSFPSKGTIVMAKIGNTDKIL